MLAGAGLTLLCAGGGECDPDPVPTVPDVDPPCTCYLAEDCGEGQTCHYNFAGAKCSDSGKMDGLCEGGPGGGGGVGGGGPGIVISEAMAAVGAGFDAFGPAIAAGGGPADANLWDSMESHVDDVNALYGARVLVHEALTITLGWDVNLEQRGYAMGRGNVRLATDPGASLAMLEATRDGVLQAMLTNDAAMVSPPLVAFWNEHPDFEPGHLGRCYPHGHDSLTYEHPVQCQLDNLEAMVGVALESGFITFPEL
ncbi:MAG: hypothetical protein AAF721_09785 [Myxococcota bacterium]